MYKTFCVNTCIYVDKINICNTRIFFILQSLVRSNDSSVNKLEGVSLVQEFKTVKTFREINMNFATLS